MSTLNVSTLSTLGGTLTIPNTTLFKYRGSVVNTATVMTSAVSTYSAATTGNGTSITDLALTITPKFSDSLILLRWMINGEPHYNTVWTVFQDGALITTTGYEAYNNVVGNSRWSGVASSIYDRDDNSTPTNMFIQYAVPAGSTSSRTYTPATRASGATARTFYLNRTLNAAAQDVYERTVSTGIAFEICQ